MLGIINITYNKKEYNMIFRSGSLVSLNGSTNAIWSKQCMGYIKVDSTRHGSLRVKNNKLIKMTKSVGNVQMLS